jgi:integrase
MPKFKTPTDQYTLTLENAIKIFRAAESQEEKILIAFLWKTGARPNELTQLKKEDMDISEDHIVLRLPTEKLGKSSDFLLRIGAHDYNRPRGPGMDILLETMVQHVEGLAPGQLVFRYGDRWQEKRINMLSTKVLGITLAPYHFRHGACSELGRTHGRTELMHFKRSKSPQSVDAYTHAMPFKVEAIRSTEARVAPVQLGEAEKKKPVE